MVTNTKEYMKEYYEKNKEELKKKATVKNKCECGCEIVHQKVAQHKKSKKHKLLMEIIELKAKV